MLKRVNVHSRVGLHRLCLEPPWRAIPVALCRSRTATQPRPRRKTHPECPLQTPFPPAFTLHMSFIRFITADRDADARRQTQHMLSHLIRPVSRRTCATLRHLILALRWTFIVMDTHTHTFNLTIYSKGCIHRLAHKNEISQMRFP